MKNIVVLVPDCLDKPMGGMGVLIKGIFDNLTPNNFNVLIVGTNSSKNPLQQIDQKFDNYRFKSVRALNLNAGQTDPIIYQFLNQMAYLDAVDIKPDIVHCFDWSTFGAGLYLKHKYNSKLICSIQLALSDISNGINPLQQISFDHGKALEIQGLLESDIVIQVSSYYAKKFFMFLDKTAIINNGVSFEEFNKDYTHLKLPGNNPKKLLYIGRYAEMKNTHTLSSITLPEGVDLLFAGCERGCDPHVWEATQRNIKVNKNMYFIGPYYNQDKINLFKSVDGVVFPSVREPFGIVGLEVLASGKPLLASNVDGMSDYLNETNHINCGTTKQTIEESIKQFLINDHYSMVQNGLDTVKKFSWKEQASKYEQIYDYLSS